MTIGARRNTRDLDKAVTRDQLLNKQDVKNIARQLSGLPSDDHAATDLLLRKLQAEKNCCVLLYKRPGEDDSSGYGLLKADFMCVLATEFQLRQFADNAFRVICVDSTHKVSDKGLKLLTLLVADSTGELVPAAFAIAREEDETLVYAFLHSVHIACEQRLLQYQARVFMSDDSKPIRNAAARLWTTVQFWLLCWWHVRENWKDKVKRVRNQALEDELWKCLMVSRLFCALHVVDSAELLQVMMHEPNLERFQQLLASFMRTYSRQPKAEPFIKYFRTYYAGEDKVHSS